MDIHSQVILLMIIASLAYSIQRVLYAKYSRTYGGLICAQIRNIAMIGTGLPLLLFSQNISYVQISSYVPWILITAIIGTIHVYTSYEAYRHVPIGISSIVKTSVKSFVVVLLSVFVLQEVYTANQGRGLLLITLGGVGLGLTKIDFSHLHVQNSKKGFLLLIITGISVALSWFFFKKYADHIDTYLAAYILEMSIGIAWLVYIVGQIVSGNRKVIHTLKSIPTKDIFIISIISFITIIGTVSTAFALKIGGYGFSSLLSVLGIPITFFLGRMFFKEKITRTQAAAVGVILIGLWVV